MSNTGKTTSKTSEGRKGKSAVSGKTVNSSSGVRGRRSSAQGKLTAAQRHEIESRERFFQHEAAFILVCFLCLFLFLANFGLLGKVGAFAGGFQKGLFGYFAYFFPICLALIVLFCIRERKNAIFWIKIASDVILGVSICTMLHLAFGSENAHSFSAYYEAGKNGELMHMAAGGAIGGFIGDALVSSIARIGAWLLMLALFLLSIVVLSEKSLINAARKSAMKAGKKAKEGSEFAKNRFEEEKIRLAARREASMLRRKEYEMERSLRSQEARVLPPGASVFDLRSERANTLSPYGNTFAGTADPGSGAEIIKPENKDFGSILGREDEICLKEKKNELPPETAVPSGILPAAEEKDAVCPDDVYDSDEVPFEETENEKYLAYGKMLNTGKIDLRSAQQMGFAVSRNSNPLSEENVSRTVGSSPASQIAAFRKEHGENEHFFEHSPQQEPEEVQTVPEPVEIFPEDNGCSAYCGTPIEEIISFDESVGKPDLKNKSGPSGTGNSKDIAPDYDDMFHITDEDRSAVYDEREKAAGKDTAYTPFTKKDSVPLGSVKPSLVKKEEPGNAGTDVAEAAAGKHVQQGEKEQKIHRRPYQFPPTGILKKGNKSISADQNEIRENARKLERVLSEFGVGVTVTNVVKGPRVTRYEMTPDVGVKVSRITSLAGDIKLAMAASELRIEAPIPGKSAVGIEVPNSESATVTFRDIMETESFRNSRSKLTWGVGLDIQGDPIIGDIAKMPHLLVSGTTGSGKSVGINSIIMSVIYRSKPEEVRMILVDPKVVELSVYDGIPHLLAPVVTKPEQALAVLNKACAEMAHRYNLFKESNTRNIIGYNDKVEEVCRTLPPDAEKPEKLPYILIIIDELSELMMHSKKDVESSIVSLTQLARAAGIHLVVATQRPSVDVVTGLIKSNIPSRVAYKLPSGIDSRTVLDTYGAENLLGNGDMLYKPGNLNNPLRVQGAYLSDGEVEEVVEWLKKHNSADYADEWQNLKTKTESNPADEGQPSSAEEEDGKDEYFYEAGLLITEKKKASIGLLQRKFKVGFNRASRIMEQLNEAGVVSDGEGTKERQILMSKEEFEGRF